MFSISHPGARPGPRNKGSKFLAGAKQALLQIVDSAGQLPGFGKAFIAITVGAILGAFVAAPPASAQSIPLVRDAEIEALIKDYTKPIFAAAGLHSKHIQVYLVNKPEFNAFVTGRRMFINLGAIEISKTPDEIKGVIAHETGHVIGGHLVRLRQRAEQAKILSAITSIIGAGAMIAGGRNASTAGQAVMMGGGQMINSQMLAYQRSEEMAADQAALRLLKKTKTSPKGLITTFERFNRNELFSSQRANPYRRSHPMPRDRIALLQTEARKSPYYNKQDSKSQQLRHDMARAKIAAYTGGMKEVHGLFAKRITSAPARYGDAIATYLSGYADKALPKINRLIKEQPNNAYLWEMKGEINLRSGRPNDAIGPFQKAVKLDKYGAGILRIELGNAYLQTGNPKNVDKAIKVLKEGLARDRNSASGYEYLARAYSMKGQNEMALAATAEARMMQGNLREAKRFAQRAMPKLKKGSPQWVRLKDIVDFRK